MKKNLHFKTNDRVKHPNRPEWGTGTVLKAAAVMHEGERYQRLTVQFENHGRANIHTAYAPLVLADSVGEGGTTPATPSSPTPSPTSPLSHLEDLLTLPPSATDSAAPFTSQLSATFNLYRYSTDARGAYDWAVAQTQLKDPLANFSRNEIELAYKQFRYLRDKHLLKLYAQAQRNNQVDTFLTLGRKLEPNAQIQIKKAMDTR